MTSAAGDQTRYNTPMNCPKCRDTELKRKAVEYHDRSIPGPDDTHKQLEVDCCPSCGGVWFDKDELDRSLDSKAEFPASGAAPNPILDDKVGWCPRCNVSMAKEPAPSNPKVTVDRCRRCGGLWLDAGELEKAQGQGMSFQEKLRAVFGDLG